MDFLFGASTQNRLESICLLLFYCRLGRFYGIGHTVLFCLNPKMEIMENGKGVHTLNNLMIRIQSRWL